jgi:Ni,Fe-hydrogenase III large subunit
MEWWTRVVKLDPKIEPIIYCNREQTVRIITIEVERLHTKLRHVDTNHSVHIVMQ